jgi:hypothetical protein
LPHVFEQVQHIADWPALEHPLALEDVADHDRQRRPLPVASLRKRGVQHERLPVTFVELPVAVRRHVHHPHAQRLACVSHGFFLILDAPVVAILSRCKVNPYNWLHRVEREHTQRKRATCTAANPCIADTGGVRSDNDGELVRVYVVAPTVTLKSIAHPCNVSQLHNLIRHVHHEVLSKALSARQRQDLSQHIVPSPRVMMQNERQLV